MKDIIAVIFPGSGSQYVGMVRTLFQQYPTIRKTFQEANDALGFDLTRICLQGNTIQLNKIQNMLLTIYTTSVAFFRLYMEELGVPPLYLTGHSLGEYSALTCSGALPFEDGLQIVRYRCEIAEEVAKEQEGVMTILKNVTPSLVERECQAVSTQGAVVTVACYNSPTQVMISGNEKAVMEAEKRILNHEEKAQIVPIIGGAPYHSPLMRSKADELKDKLSQLKWREIQWPVISNVDALPYPSKEEITNILTLQLYSPVQWEKTIRFLQNHQVTIAIEMGPKNILKNLLKENTDRITPFSFDEKLDRKTLFSMFQKVDTALDEDKKNKEIRLKAITMCLTHAVSTRNNNLDSDEYDAKAVTLYEDVKKMKDNLKENSLKPTDEQVIHALEMLDCIFQTKKTPNSEQDLRFNQILDKTGIHDIYEKFNSLRKIKNDPGYKQ